MWAPGNAHRGALLNLQSKSKIYITKDKGTLLLLCIQKMKIEFQRPECASRREHKREHSSFHLQEVKQSFMPKPSSREATAGIISSIWLRTQKYIKPFQYLGDNVCSCKLYPAYSLPPFVNITENCGLWSLVYNFNIQILCFVTFAPNCYLLWTRVVYTSMKSKTKLESCLLSPSPEYCTCSKIIAHMRA